MSQHMVIFQNPEGDPGYNQFESIEEAVSFVEKIRNEQGIDSIRIFELEEVKFDLKPYFKVELLALKAGAPLAAPAPAPAPAARLPRRHLLRPRRAAPAPAPDARSGTRARQPVRRPGSAARAAAGFPPPSGGPVPPTPPADQPAEDPQPTRRGLFGR